MLEISQGQTVCKLVGLGLVVDVQSKECSKRIVRKMALKTALKDLTIVKTAETGVRATNYIATNCNSPWDLFQGIWAQARQFYNHCKEVSLQRCYDQAIFRFRKTHHDERLDVRELSCPSWILHFWIHYLYRLWLRSHLPWSSSCFTVLSDWALTDSHPRTEEFALSLHNKYTNFGRFSMT